MIDVCRNDHAAAGYFIANLLRRELLTASYVLHFLGDDAFAGAVHLGKVAVRVLCLAAIDPLGAWLGHETVTTIAVYRRSRSAIRGIHNYTILHYDFQNAIIRRVMGSV